MFNNVPLDLAFLLDEPTAKGWGIIMGRFASGGAKDYDFDYDRWIDDE